MKTMIEMVMKYYAFVAAMIRSLIGSGRKVEPPEAAIIEWRKFIIHRRGAEDAEEDSSKRFTTRLMPRRRTSTLKLMSKPTWQPERRRYVRSCASWIGNNFSIA